jgi:hypothetical protein
VVTRKNELAISLRRRLSALAVAVIAVGSVPLPAALGSTTALAAVQERVSQTLGSANATGPVDIAIAVDESGSITSSEMAQERQAARLIALGEFSPESHVAVLGFAGADGLDTTGQQRPVDQVCPLTGVATAGNRQLLSNCIAGLHVRTAAEGNNTDFISVINQAVAALAGSGDTGRPRLIFLLTDGFLDVYGDPAYSGDQQQVATAAQANLLHQALPHARQEGVEIWPLGFGQANHAELSQIAAGGAQRQCANLPDARPRAIKVTSAAQAEAALPTIFADARCANSTAPATGQVSSGGLVSLHVTVPVIATDGTIEVVRQNPRIGVSFIDPSGQRVPDEGSLDGSTFQLGGADGPVEALRITDPVPGVWTIRLQAPQGIASTQVQASVLWQGVLRSDIVVSPPLPGPGQKVAVAVRVQVRGETIRDPSVALAGVAVSARLSGAGFTAPPQVRLFDDGRAPDATSGDGVYSGYVVIPRGATGALTFAGVVTGQGVTGDENVFSTTVLTTQLSLTGQITLVQRTVPPGGTVTGVLSLNNESGQAHRIRLILVGAAPGVTVAPSSLAVAAASGKTQPMHFSVHFAAGTHQGAAEGELRAVDAANPGHVYAQSFLTVVVTVPPPWWKQYWWAEALLVLIIILIGVALIFRTRRIHLGISTEDIEMVLYDGDREIQGLPAPAGRSAQFAFTLDQAQADRPRLELDSPDGASFVVRRGNGGVIVIVPEGEPMELQPDLRGDLGNGLSLGYRDHRQDEPPGGSSDWTDDPSADPYLDDPPDSRSRRRGRRRRNEETAAAPAGDDSV